MERDTEELAGHIGGQVLLRPARAVSRHRAVEDDGGLPAAVLGAAEGLRAAAGLRQDLGVERHSRVRVPVHQPAPTKRRGRVSQRRGKRGEKGEARVRYHLAGAMAASRWSAGEEGDGGVLTGCGPPGLAM